MNDLCLHDITGILGKHRTVSVSVVSSVLELLLISNINVSLMSNHCLLHDIIDIINNIVNIKNLMFS